MVSIAGLLVGIASALAYFHWQNPLWAAAGLLLSLGWLVADGLDGMIARATGTSSAAGRVLDGICDHGVFICIYVSLAFSLGFARSEEHTSELQSLMRSSSAVFCLKKKNQPNH